MKQYFFKAALTSYFIGLIFGFAMGLRWNMREEPQRALIIDREMVSVVEREATR